MKTEAKEKSSPNHKNKHKPAPAVHPEQTGGFAHATEPPGVLNGTNENESIESQTVRLDDPRFPITQRQAMAANIGRVQGNLHMQSLVHSLSPKEAKVSQPLSGYRQGSNGAAYSTETDVAEAQGEFEQGFEVRGLPAVPADEAPAVFRHRVAGTPIHRHTALDLFGDGTPANPGTRFEDFVRSTRQQADWFVEPSLTDADRNDLWALLRRTAEGDQILAGSGDLMLAELRAISAGDWTDLAAFGRGCQADTVQILNRSAYTLAQRISLGNTILELETVLPAEVLKVTVSEAQLADMQSPAMVASLRQYWATFAPHLERGYDPGAGARAPEFQNIINLLATGIAPFMPLLGRVRNLHRFTVPMLNALIANFGDTSRSRPVHLILYTGHDAPGSFQGDVGLYENLVLNSPNLVLMLEGQGSLAAITAEIPNIAATYGQPDATGAYRIGQAMIAGHGQTRSIQLAGTGNPSVDNEGNVSYTSESLDLDRNRLATEALLNTLLSNLDPATARVVFEGCLVGSTAVPPGTAAADIPAALADPARQSLGAFTESRGVTLGLSRGFTTAARASTGGGGAITSLMDATGNLAIQYPFDPDAYGTALAYVATGHEPEGLFRAAVEVVGTADEATATAQLRTRQAAGIAAGHEWWDESTMALVNVALTGIAPGASVPVERLNALANLAETPFLVRFGNFGITVGHFTSEINTFAQAGDIYAQMEAAPTFMAPPDLDAHKMRFIVEQARLARGEARVGQLIGHLDATPTLTAEELKRPLDPVTMAAHSAALFPAGAAATSGRIRLALAWLQLDQANADVQAFLGGQVANGAGGPELSALVRAELGGLVESTVLEQLGRLMPEAPDPAGGGATLPSANVEVRNLGVNRVLVVPDPHTATVLPRKGLNVRTLPHMGGSVFDGLIQGETVEVMGFTHNWAAIDRNGRLGFVHRNYIQRI